MKKSNSYLSGFVILIFTGAICVPFIDRSTAGEFLGNTQNWLIGVMIIGLIFSIIAVNNALNSIKYHVLKREGRIVEIADEEAAESNMLSRLWQKLQDSKPIEEESEIELDHNYDGITELDNNLPPWWLWGFYISIVFAVVYIVRFHVLGAPLQQEEYEQAMAQAEIEKAEYLKTAANLVDESNVEYLSAAADLQAGATIYAANCVACHAPDGGGGMGPNLTDAYWVHGGDIADVFSTIKYGVPSKGMIPWKDQLKPTEIQQVTSFILSLQGTTPADPKEAQGDLYAPDGAAPAEAAADSTVVEEPTDSTSN